MQEVQRRGFSEGLAEWLGSSLRTLAKDSLDFQFDLPGALDLYSSYRWVQGSKFGFARLRLSRLGLAKLGLPQSCIHCVLLKAPRLLRSAMFSME